MNRYVSTLITIVILGLLGFGGYKWYESRKKTKPGSITSGQNQVVERGSQAYTNFIFNYTLTVPDSWPVEDISDPHTAYFSPKGSLESGNEQKVYESGSFSIGVASPTIDTTENFLKFVHESIEPKLKENKVTFSGKEKKYGTYDGYELTITKPYPLTQVIINGPQVVRVTYQKKPNDFDTIVNSLKQVVNPSPDDQAVIRLTGEFVKQVKEGKIDELYTQTSPTFQKGTSGEQFRKQLDDRKGRFSQVSALVSMQTTNDTITTRSVLIDKANNRQNRLTLTFQRDGDTFRYHGVAISADQVNSFTDLDLSSQEPPKTP